MKKIIILTITLLITLITFELMSWYHIGDIPTKLVLIRLIIFFTVIFITLLLVYKKFLTKK